jgi:hypothetical protein
MVDARDIQLHYLSEDDVDPRAGGEGTTICPSSVKDGEEEKFDYNLFYYHRRNDGL